jgi:amidase
VEDALLEHDAVGLAKLVQTKKVTPAELVEAAIARAERFGHLNAIIHRRYDDARRRAGSDLPDGPLRGVPFLIKDLDAALEGAPLENGSAFFAGQIADHDSELVARYKAAGLVPLGKTNTPEFGITPVTEPATRGPTRNPWDPERTSGGSSGGSAAAVAARIVPLAHAGDGGGSIRIPASCCGIFGLKPTRGRTPVGPDTSEKWNGFAIEHVVSVSVRDSAAALDATAGIERGALYDAPSAQNFSSALESDPAPLKIGFTVSPHLPGEVHTDCKAAVADAAALLQELGHRVEEVDLDIDRDSYARDYATAVTCAIATGIELAGTKLGKRPTRRDFEPTTWMLRELGRTLSSVDLGVAMDRMRATGRRLAGVFERYDAILSPTLGRPPVRHGELAPKGADAMLMRAVVDARLSPLVRIPGLLDLLSKKIFNFIPFTPIWNVTGQPSMSVPLFWNAEDLPIGTMFTGRLGDEAGLLRLAAQLERARPWAKRFPPGVASARD